MREGERNLIRYQGWEFFINWFSGILAKSELADYWKLGKAQEPGQILVKERFIIINALVN